MDVARIDYVRQIHAGIGYLVVRCRSVGNLRAGKTTVLRPLQRAGNDPSPIGVKDLCHVTILFIIIFFIGPQANPAGSLVDSAGRCLFVHPPADERMLELVAVSANIF